MKTVQHLVLSETDNGPAESESSRTGATKSDLEPSVSTTDTQQNIELPYPGSPCCWT